MLCLYILIYILSINMLLYKFRIKFKKKKKNIFFSEQIDHDIVKGLIYSVSESVKIERPNYDGPLTEKSLVDAAPKVSVCSYFLAHLI